MRENFWKVIPCGIGAFRPVGFDFLTLLVMPNSLATAPTELEIGWEGATSEHIPGFPRNLYNLPLQTNLNVRCNNEKAASFLKRLLRQVECLLRAAFSSRLNGAYARRAQ